MTAAATTATEPMVLAQGVRKSFGANEVLKGVDLRVERGQVAVLLGPSGSGKSTFLRCINHLEKVDAGRLTVDGELVGYVEKGGRLHELPVKEVARRRTDIGMVFQRFNLFAHQTALENIVEAPVRVRGEKPDAARKRALELLERVGLVGDVLDVMRGLAKDGMTMVVVTHEIGFAREVGDLAMFLDGGVVVEAGDPRQVLVEPRHERTRAFLSKVL